MNTTTHEVNLIQEAQIDLLRAYLDDKDSRPWAVAWSGGKDSTTVTGLVVDMLLSLKPELRKRHIYFVMSDTIMENPLLETYMKQQRQLLRKLAEKYDLPITVQKVSRELNHSYFFLILGKGYPLPASHGKNRWCTDRLKIKPQEKYLNEISPALVLSGSRTNESTARSASIEKFRLEDKFARYENFDEKDRLHFMPIMNFTVEDVWRFLSVNGVPWGSTMPVRQLYKDATGECGFTNPKGTEGKQIDVCGARFGCWTCPVIAKDKSTEKMAEIYDWLEPLTNWRKTQLKVFGNFKPESTGKHLKGDARKARSKELMFWKEFNQKIKLITRTGFMRNGKRLEDGQGTLTIRAREYLYSELIETERVSNRIRKIAKLEPLQLISDEEKEMILDQIEKDRKLDFMLGAEIPIEIMIHLS